MELHTPRCFAHAKRLIRIMAVGCQQDRIGRQALHALAMYDLHTEFLGQSSKQRISCCCLRYSHLNGSDFDSARVEANFAPESIRQKLVTIANAEHRNIVHDKFAKPASQGFAPRRMFGHHGVRSSDDGAGNLAWVRQTPLAARINDNSRILRLSNALRDPLIEIPQFLGETGKRIPGLYDGYAFHFAGQKWFVGPCALLSRRPEQEAAPRKKEILTWISWFCTRPAEAAADRVEPALRLSCSGGNPAIFETAWE